VLTGEDVCAALDPLGTAEAGAARAALRGRVAGDDAAFDRLYPDHVRRLSWLHWTPVAVASRAAVLLAPEPGMRVLDAGAGPGKLCCLGALGHGGTWHGIELNPSLCAAATAAAARLGVADRTRFDAGDMHELDWRRYDSLYFYNPFEAVVFGGPATGDRWAAFADQVARTQARLAGLSRGTRVVTFHGFGGAMPPGFARAAVETIGDGELALWIKQRRPGPARVISG